MTEHDRRNVLQIYVAWQRWPASWQAVIDGLGRVAVQTILDRLQAARVAARDVQAMQKEAGL